MTVNCYPSPGKAKAAMICEAFAAGCGGRVVDPRKGLQPGAAFFYGVVDETRKVFEAARASGRDWFYCDNSYFDRGRQGYFRVTRNAFQQTVVTTPDYARFDLLGAKVKPWREDGKHIVICEQSAAFMHLDGFGAGWTHKVIEELSKHTKRDLRVRSWSRDKGKLAATLKQDLVGAWALVTHMSAAANEALLVGVPAFVTGACAALPVASGKCVDDLCNIEQPSLPGGRTEWAASLATQQWTTEEIKSGKCWRDLNG